MEQVARPYIATAAILAAGGLIAATPTLGSLRPEVHLPNIQLSAETMNDAGGASFFDSLLHWFSGDQDLSLFPISGTPNDDVVTDGVNFLESLESAGVSDGQISPTEIGQLYADLDTLLLGGGQGSFQGIGEGLDAADVNAPGFLPAGAVGADANVGGFQGATSAEAMVLGDLSAVSAYWGSAAATTALAQLQADIEAFQSSLIDAEQTFNAALLTKELALQQAAFGDGNALNGVFTDGFQAFNSELVAQEQALNTLLGAGDQTPQALGLAAEPNDGLLAAIAGLQPADFDHLFDNFNSTMFATALQGFFNTLIGGPFADDSFVTGLAPIFGDASSILDGLFAAAS
jgi:hypothetical protein